MVVVVRDAVCIATWVKCRCRENVKEMQLQKSRGAAQQHPQKSAGAVLHVKLGDEEHGFLISVVEVS